MSEHVLFKQGNPKFGDTNTSHNLVNSEQKNETTLDKYECGPDWKIPIKKVYHNM